MISKHEPENFKPKFEIVSCFVQHQDEILLLMRQDHKPQPNTYGIPAGKVDPEETIRDAIHRETHEETKIILEDITYLHKLYVRYEEYDFIYHIFQKKFEEKPEITINPNEHKHHLRIHPKKALELELIEDEDACIQLCYKDILQ